MRRGWQKSSPLLLYVVAGLVCRVRIASTSSRAHSLIVVAHHALLRPQPGAAAACNGVEHVAALRLKGHLQTVCRGVVCACVCWASRGMVEHGLLEREREDSTLEAIAAHSRHAVRAPSATAGPRMARGLHAAGPLPAFLAC